MDVKIKNIEKLGIEHIKQSWPAGFGTYDVRVKVRGKRFSANLMYQYGVDDARTMVKIDTPADVLGDNVDKLDEAADKKRLALTEDEVLEIIRRAESDAEAALDEKYGMKDVYADLRTLEGAQLISVLLNSKPKGDEIGAHLDGMKAIAREWAEQLKREHQQEQDSGMSI